MVTTWSTGQHWSRTRTLVQARRPAASAARCPSAGPAPRAGPQAKRLDQPAGTLCQRAARMSGTRAAGRVPRRRPARGTAGCLPGSVARHPTWVTDNRCVGYLPRRLSVVMRRTGQHRKRADLIPLRVQATTPASSIYKGASSHRIPTAATVAQTTTGRAPSRGPQLTARLPRSRPTSGHHANHQRLRPNRHDAIRGRNGGRAV